MRKNKLVGYKIKHLAWESNKLKKIKKSLTVHMDGPLPRELSDRILPRTDAHQQSERTAPVGTITQWTIISDPN
jgi:hypothetical protein